MGRVVDDLVRLVRVGLTRETLPEPPPEPPSAARRSRASLLTLLFAREALPLEPTRARPRRPWLAMLFAPERLDPPGGPGPEVR